MSYIQLTEHGLELLEPARETTADAQFRHAAQMYRMSRRGRRRPEKAPLTSTGPHSVHPRLNARREGEVEGPRTSVQAAKRASPELTDELAPTLRQTFIEYPVGWGLVRSKQACSDLAGQLVRSRVVRVRRPPLQASCHWQGFGPYRPTYRVLDRNEEEHAVAGEEQASPWAGEEAGEIVLSTQALAMLPMVPAYSRDARARGPSVGGWDEGLQAPDSLFRLRQCHPGGGPRRPPREPLGRCKAVGQEQHRAEAGGVHRPLAAQPPAEPGRGTRANHPDHSQRHVEFGWTAGRCLRHL
jgi:hypothetical protein